MSENMKMLTFLRYIKDFLKHQEYRFIFIAIRYWILGRPQKEDLMYRSSLGTFLTRKGTQDFMFANYAYEWNVKRFILKHHQKFNIFIDIGTNIGTYSFLLARKGLKCFAFEPVKENYEALLINIQINNMQASIQPFNFGLGDRDYNADFIYDPVNTGASHLAHNGDKGIHEQCYLWSFDSVYPSLNLLKEDRIFVKMDVEGMEIEVLNGARKFLTEFPNVFLIMESIHSGEMAIKNALLKNGDFEFYKVDHFNFASKKHI